MAEIIIPGPISGQSYGFRIKGDTPTVDEQMWIDNRIRQKESAFQTEYAAEFGAPVETGESEGFANYLGEIPKGIARGGIGIFESALLGGAALLPEEAETAAREGIRGAAYALKPQADIGLEDSIVAKGSEALGSFGALGLTSLIPFVGPAAAGALSVGAGAGEASERARAAGATEEERSRAALLGAPVGALDLLPIKFLGELGKTATTNIINRLTRAAAEGGVEGAQEAATTIAQNLIEQGIYNPEKGTFSDTGEALGYGAGVGALVQGLLDLLPGRTAKPDVKAKPPIDPATLLTQTEMKLTPPTRPGFVSGQEQGELFLSTDTPPTGGSARPATAAPTVTPTGGSVQPATAAPAPDSDEFDVETTLGALRASDGLYPKAMADLGIPYSELTKRIRSLESEGLISFDKASGKMTFPDVPKVERTVTLPEAKAPKVKEPKVKAPKIEAPKIEEPQAAEPKVEAPKATAIKPGRAIWVSADYDFPVDVADEPPKAAPDGTLYQKVFALGATESSMVPLDQLRQEPQAAAEVADTPEIVATKRKIDENQAEIDRLTAMLEESRRNTAAREAGYNPYTGEREVQDVGEGTEAQLAEAGTSVPGGTQGVGKGAGARGKGKTAEVAAASGAGGLAGSVQPTVDAGAAGGTESGALAPEEPAAPAFIPPYDAGMGAARQLIPGTITTVDPRTLQPTGKTRFEDSDVYAPSRDIPEIEPAPEPARTVLTGSPTELQIRDVLRPLKTARDEREIAAEAEANSAAQSELDAEWDAHMVNKPELASLSIAYSTPDAVVKDDPTTSQDKQKILTLLRPGGYKKGKEGQAPAKNAYNYFSRFKRPIDAIEFIVADVELKNQRFKNATALEKEIGLLPGGDETVNAAERMFFSGMTQERAEKALEWIEANMSPQVQVKVRELRQMYKKAEETKVPNKVTSSLASSTAIGGRSANLEERQIFEQELVVQATEATVNKVADAELAVVATTAAGDAAKLAAAARERVKRVNELLAAQKVADAASAKKEPSAAARIPMPVQKPRSIAGMTKNKQIELTTDYIIQAIGSNSSADATPLNFNRAEDVRDLDLPLHPAVINALRNGDLELALRTLELYAPNARVKRIANALAPYAKGTSVRIVKDLKDDSGRSLAGQYRRLSRGRPSEILIDEDIGFSIETLLHEMTHAATVKEMQNPASPLRKRMEALFNEVKPKLSTSNGSRDVMEFMADAFSNPRFQSELASIYPNGGRFSALWRIANDAMNLVRRLLGLPPRQMSNALDMTDQMVMRMLNFPVSPTDISNPQEAATILNRVAAIDGSFPARTKEFGQQFGDDASRVLDGASYGAKRAVLGFMNSQALADVAGYFNISGARDLQNAIDQHDAAAIKSDSEVDAVLDIAQKWTKNNTALKPLFDRLVHRSTINQVDPSLPRDVALKKYGADSEKMRQYDAMQADWKAIGRSGHDLYNNMRQLYRKQYERLREALAGKIDFILSGNPELAAEIKKSVYTKFFSMNEIEPYFPLAREGDFWLEYSAFDPETNTTEPVRETYDSPNARARAIKELESMPEVVKGPDGKPITSIYSTLDLVQRGRMPDSLFVRDTLSIIKANLASTGVDAATSDSIQQEITKLFVSALPETSFAKSLQRRKNTRGYMEDSVNALRVKGYNLGRQGVRYGYSNKIRAIADGIAQQAKKTDDQSKIAVITELADRAEFAVNPPNTPFERAVQTANRTAFTFTLGLNVSSALVNLSSIPVVLYPYLSGRYGARSSAAAIGNAYKVFINSGLSREIELPAEFQGKRTSTVRAMPSIDNYFVLREKRTVGADGKEVVTQEYVLRDGIPAELRPALQELATLVDVASKNGQLNRSIFYDSIGAEDVGRARNLWDRFSAISGAMFHQVERANRQVALVAAYNLELARLRNKPRDSERGLSEAEQRTRAAERAVYQATETGGGATLAAAPRFAQKGIGRVALMYKNFGLSLFYMQMKLLKQLTVGSNDPSFTPEDRRVAFKQLVGLQLSSFAFAGVSGVPLYGLVSMIADAFLGEDEEDADSLTRKYLGEGLYKGFLTDMSGLDISSRIGLTGLLIRENRYNTDPSAEETLVANLGGPAWSTVTQAGRGVSEFYSAMTGGEGDMVRGIENMVPAAVRNFIKAGRYIYDGGDIETRRKDIITGDLGSSDLLGQALGFTPTKATLAQDLNQLTLRISNAVVEKRSRLSKLYYTAMRVGDIEGAKEALKAIRAFNKDIAQRFPEAVIDNEFLKDSYKDHERTSKEMSTGVSLNPVVREELEVLKSMYNQGVQLF